MAVTEIACFPIKAGVKIEANEVPDGFKQAMDRPGAQRVYWSQEVENPSRLWGFVDWNTIDDHRNWIKNPQYATVMKGAESSFDTAKGFVKHVDVKPFPATQVLDCSQGGATEVLLSYFPADITESAKATVSKQFEEFIEKGLKASPDFKGVSYGWGVEKDFPIRGNEDETGTLFLALIGWPSVAAHMKFRNSKAFQSTIGILRDYKDLLGLAACHVSCHSRAAQK